ncbi:nuclear transport factor 2 family protein [Nocardia sp. alder85J]|uniref:nuclear transport factor 2 family protein n=1 Tax=Nocardia sp. alder85J TaxID=2862949 RepID=UPI001CD4331E|nr:nuclear transport factor 2 family protein [Nocardia sp. alder85J]MCX4091715.1 nuclear transport factor 2 family protein [Nocardia sp. alder85J]
MSTDSALADRLDITDLFTRLGRLLDERRWDDLGTVYAEDVAVNSPRMQVRGLTEVLGFVRTGTAAEGEHTQHTTTDVLVDVEGDRATASANSFVYYYRDGERPHQTSGLRLAVVASRTPAGWRISESRISLAWTTKD